MSTVTLLQHLHTIKSRRELCIKQRFHYAPRPFSWVTIRNYRSETVSSPGAASVKPRLDDIEGKPLPPLLIGLEYRDRSAAVFAAVCHWRTFALSKYARCRCCSSHQIRHHKPFLCAIALLRPGVEREFELSFAIVAFQMKSGKSFVGLKD